MNQSIEEKDKELVLEAFDPRKFRFEDCATHPLRVGVGYGNRRSRI